MEDLRTILELLVDLKVLGENIEYENSGIITVPVEKAGLRFGPQRSIKTNGNTTTIKESNFTVIQKDKTIINHPDDIIHKCAKAGCENFVLKKYAPLLIPHGKLLCMTHLIEKVGEKIFEKLIEMHQRELSEPKVELAEESGEE